jgi:phosphate transport system substrate-binding protein
VRLPDPLVAQIFTGQMDSWRDPAMLAAQAGDVAARLPERPIRRVVRSDSSGTTALLMQYPAAVAPEDMQALRDRFHTCQAGGPGETVVACEL